ncbi:hypothetical protein SAY86_007733 [Trapa natans]|uniref:Uncharacterized protein n=1 Tax=Trapa natans TaxID=22666 RepID=A0AAN7LFM2_TRANT|nr:hypothetical protein SAY86_007733 [Trapa natans]
MAAMEIERMEYGGSEKTAACEIPKRGRIPPKRGKVKVCIFKLLVEKMAWKLKKPRESKKHVCPL